MGQILLQVINELALNRMANLENVKLHYSEKH